VAGAVFAAPPSLNFTLFAVHLRETWTGCRWPSSLMVSDMLKSLRSSAAVAVLLCFGLSGQSFAQSASDNEVRLQQLEEQMRSLVGQVEQLTFEVKQLKAQIAKTNTGAAAPMPAVPKPVSKLATTQDPGASSEGIEQIDGGSLADSTVSGSPDGGDTSQTNQPGVLKAPGPKVLGALGSGASAQAGDGGFQGQVLVAPAQQDVGDDSGVLQGNVQQPDANGNGGDSVQNVALAPDSPESLYERSNESLLRRQFGDAEAGFRTFLQKYPDHSLAGSAQYWLGETYYAQRDYKQAAQAFLSGYKQYPNSRRAPDSLVKLGISLGQLGQTQQACAAYGAVDTEFPKAVEARKRAQAEAKRAGCSG